MILIICYISSLFGLILKCHSKTICNPLLPTLSESLAFYFKSYSKTNIMTTIYWREVYFPNIFVLPFNTQHTLQILNNICNIYLLALILFELSHQNLIVTSFLLNSSLQFMFGFKLCLFLYLFLVFHFCLNTANIDLIISFFHDLVLLGFNI